VIKNAIVFILFNLSQKTAEELFADQLILGIQGFSALLVAVRAMTVKNWK
jgi:hypothetical protein